jgi:uncharacterized protein
VNTALLISALLMGLTGSVHCVAMCGGSSAAVVGACGGARASHTWLGFHLGRLVGYAAAGALAASSVMLLAQLGSWSPALRPLWTLAHMAGLLLGLYLLWQGRQPPWLEQWGRGQSRSSQSLPPGWQRIQGPTRAAAVGSLWFAWPCGLLQSALMVAALANGPVAGAMVMAVFATASSAALVLGPALWLRWSGQGAAQQQRWLSLVVRASGAALAAASIWALGHDLWVRVLDYCLS